MYNTLLYIGITFLLSGFVLFVIAVNMEIYYDRKLYKLQQRIKNGSTNKIKTTNPYHGQVALSNDQQGRHSSYTFCGDM